MQRRLISFHTPAISHLEIPRFDAVGKAGGPTLALLGGVHGCEYTSQKAVRDFMSSLNEDRLTGRIRAIPTLNVESFYERTPFVSPSDGKNLNRCFPGKPKGTYSEELAYAVTEHVIKGADCFIDLHAGDMVEDLTPFTIHEASSVADKSRSLGEAYGFRFCLRQPVADRAVAGASTSAAADLGVASIIAESGGRGLLEDSAVLEHILGLRRLTRYLGMYDWSEEEAPSPGPVRHMNSFVWLRARTEGWWEPSVKVGEEVVPGMVVGTITDLFGVTIETISAPEMGVPVFITSSPAVKADGLLLGLAGGEQV